MAENKTPWKILFVLKNGLRGAAFSAAALGIGLGIGLGVGPAPAAPADTQELVKKLKSPDPETRRLAAKEIGDLGAGAKEAVPALAAALKDGDKFVRRFAAQSLAKIGEPAVGARDALAGVLKNPQEQREVQEAAAQALSVAGKKGVAPLADAVKNTALHSSVRTRAADSLGLIGPEAKDAVPALMEALKAQDVRLNAATALGKIGPEAKPAAEKLQEMYDKKGERDRPFKTAVKDALRKINGPTPASNKKSGKKGNP